MKYEETFEIVKNLAFDTDRILYKEDDTELFIHRPSKLSSRFKDYDVNKNFQIWMREGHRNFRPNHLRIMIDLNLRVRSRPDLVKELCLAFDNIFYHQDPDECIKDLNDQDFEHNLNSIQLIANLHQLFIIEQEYCYNKPSKYDPPTLFYQGWIRQFLVSGKEIDNLCMSVCNRQPPQAIFTSKENRKHKKFNPKVGDVWYLDEVESGQTKIC